LITPFTIAKNQNIGTIRDFYEKVNNQIEKYFFSISTGNLEMVKNIHQNGLLKNFRSMKDPNVQIMKHLFNMHQSLAK